MKTIVAGIDIGGTNTEIGLTDRDGHILHSTRFSTKSFATPDKMAEQCSNWIINTCTENSYHLAACGIGAPSGNYYSGSIEHAPNMPWRGIIPLAGLFEKQLKVQTTLTNDANAAAIGEMIFGKAKGLRDFIVVTLGTGVGSGFVSNGELIYGHDGFAGELGHVMIDMNGRLCGCGRKGCLETYTSATGVVYSAIEKIRSGQPTTLALIPEKELTSRHVFDAAQNGDIAALEIFDETSRLLAFALANAVAITSPSHIFLYGGLARSGNLLFEPLMRYFDAYVLQNYKGKVSIEMSGLPENAAVLGAAAIGWSSVK